MEKCQYWLGSGSSCLASEQPDSWDDEVYQPEQASNVSSHFEPEFSLETQHTKADIPVANHLLPKHVFPQSALHNCPKHLIGFVGQALELRQLQDLKSSDFLRESPQSLRSHLSGLLRLIFLSLHGIIRSRSRQLLKIVFESGSEEIKELKLLDNPKVKAVFSHAMPAEMAQAKQLLRQHTLRQLQLRKRKMFESSRICDKTVNRRYMELFMRQLQDDRIRQRITKREKLQILGSEVEQM